MGLATLSGVMVFTSYPAFDLFVLQWFALVPLLWAIEGKRVRSGFFYGWWAGFVTNTGGFYWIVGMLQDFGHFSLVLAIPIASLLWLYQGLVFALWAALVRWLGSSTRVPLMVVAPIAWVVVEYVVPFIFPWYLANGQYLFYPAIQVVELTGVLGLSFLLVFVNVGLYLALRQVVVGRFHAALRPALLALGLFGANVLYGTVRMYQVDELMEEAPKLKIGLGEADVGIFEKEAKGLSNRTEKLDLLRGNILKHHLLAADLERQGVDLVVEPESSFIPVPDYFVQFKRNDLFAVVGGDGRNAWELRDERWTGAKRTDRHATATNDVWAAREDRIFAVGPRGLILRHDGADWQREASHIERDLHGVWVGEYSPIVRRVDGAPVAVFAVGDGGTALLRERDGAWKAMDTGVKARFRDVGGRSAGRVVAVGDGGLIMRWDSKRWHRVDSGTGSDLHGVWVGEKGVAVAVGADGTIVRRSGGRWSAERLEGAGTLEAVTGGGTSGTWIAGQGGGMWRRHGKSWRRVSTPTTRDLHGLSQTGRGTLLAVGDAATVLTRGPGADAQWVEGPTLRDAGDLRAVAGVPFTAAHAFARDARYVYRSTVDLPDLPSGWSTLDAVEQIDVLRRRDERPQPGDWNTPLRGFETPILMGLLTYEPKDPAVSALRSRDDRRTYNSAMLLDGKGRVQGRYDKNYLLIFGEYIPLGDVFPQFYEWLPETSHFHAGETVESFAFQGHQLGVLVCYEDILPSFTRKLAGKDPHVLINVTNDAWFGKTSEPYLHLALSIFRAVENRLWLIRSTNTGVSVFVDAVGRIVAETGLEDPEMLVSDVPMLRSGSLYRSYGDLFTYLVLVAFAILSIAALRKERTG